MFSSSDYDYDNSDFYDYMFFGGYAQHLLSGLRRRILEDDFTFGRPKKKTPDNLQKEKICIPVIDAILLDDLSAFVDVITDEELANKRFIIVSQKLPSILNNAPPLLSVAAFFGATEICNYLISMGVKQDVPDEGGLSIAHFAAAGGNLSIFKDFVKTENYSDTDDSMNFPIHYAALMGRTDIVKYIWSKKNDLITVMGNNKKAPIHFACENGHVDVVDFLLSQGVYVNEPDRMKRTPLIYAAKGGHYALTVFLLDHKAEVDAKDSTDKSALIYAAQNGYLSIVKVLISKSASYKYKKRKYNALVEASGAGQLGIVKFLISKGVDVNIPTSDFVTPLYAAIQKNRVNTIKYLIERGASVNCPLPADIKNYDNILNFVCKMNYHETLRYLLEKRIYSPDEVTHEMISSCLEKNSIEMMKVFEDFNIDILFLLDQNKTMSSFVNKYEEDFNKVALYILEYIERHGTTKFGKFLEYAKALNSNEIFDFMFQARKLDLSELKIDDDTLKRAKDSKGKLTEAVDLTNELLCTNAKENPNENVIGIIENFLSNFANFNRIKQVLNSGIKLSLEFLQNEDTLNDAIQDQDKETFDKLIEMGIDLNTQFMKSRHYYSSFNKTPLSVCLSHLSMAIQRQNAEKATTLFDMLNTLFEKGASITKSNDHPLRNILGCRSILVFDTIKKYTKLTKEYIEENNLVKEAIQRQATLYFDWFMSYQPNLLLEPSRFFYFEETNIFDIIRRMPDAYGYYFLKSIITSSKRLTSRESLFDTLFKFSDFDLFKQCALKGALLNSADFYKALLNNFSIVTCDYFTKLLQCGMAFNVNTLCSLYIRMGFSGAAPRRSLLYYLITFFKFSLNQKDVISSALSNGKFATALVLMQCGQLMPPNDFPEIFDNGYYDVALYFFSKLLAANFKYTGNICGVSVPAFMLTAGCMPGYHLFKKYGYKDESNGKQAIIRLAPRRSFFDWI